MSAVTKAPIAGNQKDGSACPTLGASPGFFGRGQTRSQLSGQPLPAFRSEKTSSLLPTENVLLSTCLSKPKLEPAPARSLTTPAGILHRAQLQQSLRAAHALVCLTSRASLLVLIAQFLAQPLSTS